MASQVTACHKGSRIIGGRDFWGGFSIKVDGKVAKTVRFFVYHDHTIPVMEADVECRKGSADLALYYRRRAFREEFVLMDGDDVIAATHPLALPRSRRPAVSPTGPEPRGRA